MKTMTRLQSTAHAEESMEMLGIIDELR